MSNMNRFSKSNFLKADLLCFFILIFALGIQTSEAQSSRPSKVKLEDSMIYYFFSTPPGNQMDCMTSKNQVEKDIAPDNFGFTSLNFERKKSWCQNSCNGTFLGAYFQGVVQGDTNKPQKNYTDEIDLYLSTIQNTRINQQDLMYFFFRVKNIVINTSIEYHLKSLLNSQPIVRKSFSKKFEYFDDYNEFKKDLNGAMNSRNSFELFVKKYFPSTLLATLNATEKNTRFIRLKNNVIFFSEGSLDPGVFNNDHNQVKSCSTKNTQCF